MSVYHTAYTSNVRSLKDCAVLCAFQTCQIGLNFANEEEAKRFRCALNDLISRRQKKTGDYAILTF